MNSNSLEAYDKLDLTEGEQKAIRWLTCYGPLSQAELIAEVLAEPEYASMEDAQRVKLGQNMYARLHGLKQKGIAMITGTTQDPWTGNTVDVYAFNPDHSTWVKPPKKLSAKELLKRIEILEEKLSCLPIGASLDVLSMLSMVRKLRD
jgi:hypothetical protein